MEISRIEGKSIAKLFANVVRSVNRIARESTVSLPGSLFIAKNYDTHLRRKHESDS